MVHYLVEAVVVGVVLVLIGLIIANILKMFDNNTPDNCKNWNDNFIMEKTLFLIGFFTHVFFEITGGNKWYCKYGNACKI